MAETEDYLYLEIEALHTSFMCGALSKNIVGNHVTSH